MQEKLQALIERYGRSVSLSMEDGWHSPQFRALIQPLRYKKQNVSGRGAYPDWHPRPGLLPLYRPCRTRCDKARQHGGRGVAQRLRRGALPDRPGRTVYLGEEALYIWAILRSVTEAEQ